MICISIVQESRRLALADMVNASRQCDLLEVRLDHFSKAPEVGELLTAKPRPVIMSCRRPQDGGFWEGTEAERLALLRQCIIGKADYAEIELDVADQIRRFPPTRRVISYTNLQETPPDIADIYEEARSKNADVVKLTTFARTPEEAWPLVQILCKPALPTVVVGLGKPGVMLTVLGKKIGAPWTYAALERGMEAYPGQPTVSDLEAVYHYRSVGRGTPLIGVTGFTGLEYATVAALNAAFAGLGVATRCLPLQVGDMQLFRKVMKLVRLGAVVVGAAHRSPIVEVATDVEAAVKKAGAADLLVQQGDKWQAYNLLCRAAVEALESALRAAWKADKPLAGRTVMIAGSNAVARSLAFGIKHRGGIPIIAGHDRDAAHELALHFGCRHVQFEALYSMMHDVLIVCGDEAEQPRGMAQPKQAEVHGGYLKEGMAVMDLSAMPRSTALLRDAGPRGCTVVSPRKVFLDLVALQVRLIAGKEAPREPLEEVCATLTEDED
jgi:3-dehydroquinate dehydratase/shikimate dehydrogenase